MEYESYSLCVLPADIAGLISGRHMDFSVHDIFLILPAEGVCWQHAHYLTLKGRSVFKCAPVSADVSWPNFFYQLWQTWNDNSIKSLQFDDIKRPLAASDVLWKPEPHNNLTFKQMIAVCWPQN